MKTKQIEYEGFPRIYKDAKLLQVIYRDHVEIYKLISKHYDHNDYETREFDPYKEIEMAKGNNMRRVHGMKTVKVIDFTR